MLSFLASAGRFALTLLVGLIGGYAFVLIGLPAPWLTGAMVAITATTLAGVRPYVPGSVRDFVFVVLGISIGAGVTPEAVAGFTAWPISILALVVSLPLVVVAVTAYLDRVAGWDRATAFFASLPGALTYVMAMAMESRADTKRVALSQTIRLFVLVAFLPSIVVQIAPNPEAVRPTTMGGALGGGPVEVAVMLAGGTLGALAAHWLRVPAGLLVGAMIASGTLHATGIVGLQVPPWLLVPGLIMLGAVVGARFEGTDWGMIRTTIGPAFGAFAIAAGVCLVFALAVSWGIDVPLSQTLLAYAPGGVEAMTIMAFAMNVDPAFVGAHHVVRFIVLSFALPFWARPYLVRP